MSYKLPLILVINTGSTSTKIAVFEAQTQKFQTKISHTVNELSKLHDFDRQVDFRLQLIKQILLNNNLKDFDLIMTRGGLIKPVASGVYQVNQKMINDLKHTDKQHASNLAAVIGLKLSENKIPVYIADPVVVDELQDIARISGHKLFERKSIFHALNHKAVARKYAEKIGKSYEDLNLIVVHMGGGISVGAHCKGKVIDVNQALDGEGPFSPERSGTLPAGDLVKLSFSGKYTQNEIEKMLVGKGGLVSYLGTNDMQEIEKLNDSYAMKILKAMAYQIAKSIGEMAVVLKGKVDAVILTGGVAYSNYIVNEIQNQVKFIGKLVVSPGEDEMAALAFNGNLVWSNKIEPKEY